MYIISKWVECTLHKKLHYAIPIEIQKNIYNWCVNKLIFFYIHFHFQLIMDNQTPNQLYIFSIYRHHYHHIKRYVLSLQEGGKDVHLPLKAVFGPVLDEIQQISNNIGNYNLQSPTGEDMLGEELLYLSKYCPKCIHPHLQTDHIQIPRVHHPKEMLIKC